MDLTSKLTASHQDMLVHQSPALQSYMGRHHAPLTSTLAAGGGQQQMVVTAGYPSSADQMTEVTEGLRGTADAILHHSQQYKQGMPDVMSAALASIQQYFQGAAGNSSTSGAKAASGTTSLLTGDSASSRDVLTRTQASLAEALLASSSSSTVSAPTSQQQHQDMDAVNSALQQALMQSHRDPVEAAEKLRSFILQYKGQYGASASSRVSSTASKLQAFIDSHQGASKLPTVIAEGKATEGPWEAAVGEW
jgi:hypothetical protein